MKDISDFYLPTFSDYCEVRWSDFTCCKNRLFKKIDLNRCTCQAANAWMPLSAPTLDTFVCPWN